MTASILEDDWTGTDVSIAEIERELARLRYASAAETAQPNLRTSVMTHIAWVPPQWLGVAEETLAGMAERHPSRTLLLVPHPEAEDGIDAELSIRCFPVGDRAVCGEVIELALRGSRSQAPASIVLPLLVSDLPVFCRWRGEPPVRRVSVRAARRHRRPARSSTRPSGATLAAATSSTLFERTAVSDIAWSRTLKWRAELARFWPSIREQEIYVRGPRAEATLLSAWLGARLARPMRPIEEAPELGVRLGGEEIAAPHGVHVTPSDLLSAELDRYGRDPIYEEAVAAAAVIRRLTPANPHRRRTPGLRYLSDRYQRHLRYEVRQLRANTRTTLALAGRRTHPVSHGLSEANRRGRLLPPHQLVRSLRLDGLPRRR